MGMDLSVYVGPVIKIDENANTTHKVPEEVTGCPKCFHKTRDTFCSKCGTKVETREVMVDREIAMWDIFPENEDIFYSNEYTKNVLMSNYDNFGKSLDDNGETYVFSPEKASEEVEAFKAKYADELKRLEDAYGEGMISVQFAVVSYWS